MSKFIEVENDRFQKMVFNVDAIAMVSERETIKSYIYIVGKEAPFSVRQSYREVKSLIEKA